MNRQFLLAAVAAAIATPALAQPASTASSIPNMTGIWRHQSLPGPEPLASGPTSVTNRSRRNGVSNYNELVGDYTNPILKPEAAATVKKFGELSIAGDYEFFARPEWAGIRKAYGLQFREQRQMQPEFMYAAAAHGEIDVISAYTSDGRVAQFDLQVLDDPRHAIPPYDAILLVSPKRADDQAFLDALRPLVDTINVEIMREANRRSSEGASPQAAARWLAERIGR